jgi:hypothetical protein
VVAEVGEAKMWGVEKRRKGRMKIELGVNILTRNEI